jgi:hypothetical protein
LASKKRKAIPNDAQPVGDCTAIDIGQSARFTLGTIGDIDIWYSEDRDELIVTSDLNCVLSIRPRSQNTIAIEVIRGS